MAEQWKIIDEFPAYAVSDLGRVKRVAAAFGATVGKILKLTVDRGYFYVGLVKNRKTYNKTVHVLVAKAFIPNPLNLPQVNHTGEKSDNRAVKLEWRSLAGHVRDKALRGQQGKGVCFNKVLQKWRAYFYPEPYKYEHIGYFVTYEEALTARAKAMQALPYIL